MDGGLGGRRRLKALPAWRAHSCVPRRHSWRRHASLFVRRATNSRMLTHRRLPRSYPADRWLFVTWRLRPHAPQRLGGPGLRVIDRQLEPGLLRPTLPPAAGHCPTGARLDSARRATKRSGAAFPRRLSGLSHNLCSGSPTKPSRDVPITRTGSPIIAFHAVAVFQPAFHFSKEEERVNVTSTESASH